MEVAGPADVLLGHVPDLQRDVIAPPEAAGCSRRVIAMVSQCCYNSAVTPLDDTYDPSGPVGEDPTLHSGVRPLRELLAAMDADIGRVYAERGVTGVRPRFSMALIRLHHRGPMTVTELAEQLAVTHSAMSQTVAAMRRDGLVDSSPGPDARTRTVTLTGDGRALVPFLEDEWRATERAWAELDAELPHPLSGVVEDMAAALARRSFRDRITHELDRPCEPQP